MGKCKNISFHRKIFWVQEVKVILSPLTQDSHNMIILNISSNATKPVVAKFYVKPPAVAKTKRKLSGHMTTTPKDGKTF